MCVPVDVDSCYCVFESQSVGSGKTNKAQPSFLTFQLNTQVIVETRERRFIQQDYHGEVNNRSPVTPKSVFIIRT